MSTVASLAARAAVKCRPGKAAFHAAHGWCTVTAANGLMREIEVLLQRSSGRAVTTDDLPNGVAEHELLQEEILTVAVYDVHVSELEEAMPPRLVHGVDKNVAVFGRKVVEQKATFSA